jgi:hypothetical protein
MSFRTLNLATGWAVWAIATVVYILTLEPTASFWDCGEFIASAYKLEVGHPPGAPLFMLLARFLMIFGSPENAAWLANMLSALASSFTILFLFWTITHLARRFTGHGGQDPAGAQVWAILGSGAIGALAYTFSDTFWFSAVEGEVYALSSLFTALVFWAILKWENVADEPGHAKWLLVIAYLMGLSIGIHLLNLLAIPAIALVVYFRKYTFSWKGLFLALATSGAILLVVQEGIIKGVVQLAGKFELFFVNGMGMPFNTGVLIYAVIVVAVVGAGIWWSHRTQRWTLNTVFLSVALLLLGYSSFAVIVIRSGANPPMDENNPENLFALLSYLNREQYGDRPLSTGQFWDSPTDEDQPYEDGTPTWVKSFSVYEKKGVKEVRLKSFRERERAEAFIAEGGNRMLKEEYVDSGEKKNSVPNFDPEFTMVFPRMYSDTPSHIEEYMRWSNYKNYNLKTTYKSPLADGELTESELSAHIELEFLGAGKSASELTKDFNALFRLNGARFSDNFEVESDSTLLVRNPESGQMQRAPLSSLELRPTVAAIMVDALADGADEGEGYAQGLRGKKQELEAALRQAIAVANAGNEEARSEALQLQQMLDRVLRESMPSQGENLRFFVDYQMGWMYFRYFLWNFVGRQNDIQGHGDFLHGNWLSGIDAIDAARLGDRSALTDEMRNDKGLNAFYFLPLIFGLIGLVFHFRRDPRQFTVVLSLFVLTGIAIVVYLNQYPLQPRERDYAYVGSFYAFAIWVGLGVYALVEAARSLDAKGLGRAVAGALGSGAVVWGVSAVLGGDSALGMSALFMGAVASALVALAYGLGRVDRKGPLAGAVLVGISLLVPVVMAADGWDDHDRSHRRTAVDFAKNYLDSLEPNAILFTNGDNDTFPLWYVQEVEGYRTDVRICNLSLLNTDWYVDQMKRRTYESAPLPISMDEEKYRQGTRDIVLLDRPAPGGPEAFNLHEALKVALDDADVQDYGRGKTYAYLPGSQFSLPVDRAQIQKLGFLNEEDWAHFTDTLTWTIDDESGNPRQYILKGQLALLDMLATNNWERPIYFAVTTGPDAYLGLEDHFRLEGLAYRLVPVKYPPSDNPNAIGGVARDKMYGSVMEQWHWGNMDRTEGSGVYLDENNRRMVTNLRLQMSNLARAFMDTGDGDRAVDVLDKLMSVTPVSNVPYTRVVLPMQELLCELTCRDTVKAKFAAKMAPEKLKRADALHEELTRGLMEQQVQMLRYLAKQDVVFAAAAARERSLAVQMADRIVQVLRVYHADSPLLKEMEEAANTAKQDLEGREAVSRSR